MAKTKWRPQMVNPNLGRKTVDVKPHKLSKPKPLGKKCLDHVTMQAGRPAVTK